MNDDDTTVSTSKKGWFGKLSTPVKVAGAVTGVAAVSLIGKAIYDRTKKKPEEEKASAPPVGGMPHVPPPDLEVIETPYVDTPGIAVKEASLPFLKSGSTYWVLGPDAPGFSTELAKRLTNNPAPLPTTGTDSDTFLHDFAEQVKALGLDQLPKTDLWIAILQNDSAPTTVAKAMADIATIRAKLPQSQQRILWMLGVAAPGAYAKALNLSHEEWVRIADEEDIPRVVTAATMPELLKGITVPKKDQGA
jgi:hypothetical protein